MQQFRIKQDANERVALDARWIEINKDLKKSKKGYEEPALPFQQDKLIREYNLIYYKVYDKVKAVDL